MSIVLNGTKGINQNTTEVTKIPVGTTAQRPENPEAGMIRFNTDEGYVEWYDDVTDVWTAISSAPGVVASGGTVTDITKDGLNYRVHTFTSSGTFEVTRSGEVEYLVVAGGGGGGYGDGSGTHGSGGGGAGGVVLSELTQISSGSFNCTIGSGGLNGGGGGSNRGQNGGDSEFLGLIALGGGGGGARNGNEQGADGGSGGGSHDNPGGSATQPGTNSTATDFGNDGGDSEQTSSSSNISGSGGGGAGEPGQNAASMSDRLPFDGGIGIDLSNIFGSSVGDDGFFGGGGAGAPDDTNSIPRQLGGKGGGGDSGASDGSGRDGIDAMPNTGGGGGGGNINASKGGDGGSGIVIVRYRIG